MGSIERHRKEPAPHYYCHQCGDYFPYWDMSWDEREAYPHDLLCKGCYSYIQDLDEDWCDTEGNFSPWWVTELQSRREYIQQLRNTIARHGLSWSPEHQNATNKLLEVSEDIYFTISAHRYLLEAKALSDYPDIYTNLESLMNRAQTASSQYKATMEIPTVYDKEKELQTEY